MNLIIDREELIRGLSRVQGIVERRTTNMALAHVLLSAENNTLRMTATDTMVSLVADFFSFPEMHLIHVGASFFLFLEAVPHCFWFSDFYNCIYILASDKRVLLLFLVLILRGV